MTGDEQVTWLVDPAGQRPRPETPVQVNAQREVGGFGSPRSSTGWRLQYDLAIDPEGRIYQVGDLDFALGEDIDEALSTWCAGTYRGTGRPGRTVTGPVVHQSRPDRR